MKQTMLRAIIPTVIVLTFLWAMSVIIAHEIDSFNNRDGLYADKPKVQYND